MMSLPTAAPYDVVTSRLAYWLQRYATYGSKLYGSVVALNQPVNCLVTEMCFLRKQPPDLSHLPD